MSVRVVPDAVKARRTAVRIASAMAPAECPIFVLQTPVSEILAVRVREARIAQRVENRYADIDRVTRSCGRAALPTVRACVDTRRRAATLHILFVHRYAVTGFALGVELAGALKRPCILRVTRLLDDVRQKIQGEPVGNYREIVGWLTVAFDTLDPNQSLGVTEHRPFSTPDTKQDHSYDADTEVERD